jgi:parvulin-like peptidyl-prolyl isomerase
MLERGRVRTTGRLRNAFAGFFSWARRSVALPLAGIVSGLALAGAGLVRRSADLPTSVPPGYVALVNGQGLLTSDFISETKTTIEKPFNETTPGERARVLREMIDKELLVQRALVLDLPETTTEVRTTMADAVNAQAAAPALAQQPTQADLLAYYKQHLKRYQSFGTMQFRDLVLRVGGFENTDQTFSQAEADAIEAVYQLRSGTPLEQVIEQFGLVDSGAGGHGPQLDFAAKIHLGPRLYAIAGALSTGQVSDPVTTADGVHIIVMQVRQPPSVEDFPSARAQVYSDYRQSLAKEADAANLEILRRNAQILVAPGLSQ